MMSRIGDFIFSVVRRILPPGGFLTPSRKVNDILLVVRNWRVGFRWGEPIVQVPMVEAVDVTVLVGDHFGAGDVLQAAVGLAGMQSAQVLGFRFGGEAELPPGAVRVDELAGCGFPEFFGVLAGALTRVAGRSLVAVDGGLLGLGLGLLCNYHFGRPLYTAGRAGAEQEQVVLDWGDRTYLDPNSKAWSGVLTRFRERVPAVPEGGVPLDGAVAVLPAAREFAELFAAFYEHERGRA